jgi:hypothetical protein
MLTDSAAFVSNLLSAGQLGSVVSVSTASAPQLRGAVPGEPPTLAMAAIGIVTVCIYLAAGGLRRTRQPIARSQQRLGPSTGSSQRPTREAA